jgi:hypothetical protein
VQDDLTYQEEPMQILDRKEQRLRTKVIRLVLVKWGRHSNKEATWESEDTIRAKYPQLFDNAGTKSSSAD